MGVVVVGYRYGGLIDSCGGEVTREDEGGGDGDVGAGEPGEGAIGVWCVAARMTCAEAARRLLSLLLTKHARPPPPQPQSTNVPTHLFLD